MHDVISSKEIWINNKSMDFFCNSKYSISYNSNPHIDNEFIFIVHVLNVGSQGYYIYIMLVHLPKDANLKN